MRSYSAAYLAGDGIGSKMGTVGKVLGAAFVAAGTAAVGFGIKAVGAASDLQEQISKVGVVFGQSSGIVTGFANQMAKDFGLPKTAMLEAASSIGLVGKASGLAQADAANLGTGFAKLAADASSFYNVPLEEALAAIQSGLVGEAEPLRRYGVLLSEAAVQQEAVASVIPFVMSDARAWTFCCSFSSSPTLAIPSATASCWTAASESSTP